MPGAEGLPASWQSCFVSAMSGQSSHFEELEGGREARLIDVSIIMLSYNTRDLLEQCLRSIEEKVKGVSYEIIIIDNASADQSVEMVRSKFPQATLVCNEQNLFGPLPLNHGIRISRGRYVMIVNTDVIFLDGVCERMYEYLETHQEVAAVSPRLVDANGSAEACFCRERTFQSCIYNWTFLRRLFPRKTARINGHLLMKNWSRYSTYEVEILIDVSMMIRREALVQIGMYDEAFKLYFLDDDLSKRLRTAGWRLVFLGDVENLHYRHQSVKQQPESWIISIYREDALAYSRKYFGAARTALLRQLMWLTGAMRSAKERVLRRQLLRFVTSRVGSRDVGHPTRRPNRSGNDCSVR